MVSTLDWQQERAVYPNGKTSASWKQHHQGGRYPRELVKVRFATADCRACPLRARGTRSPNQAKALNLQPEAAFEALKAARAYTVSPKGREAYRLRAGVESTLSQGVRAFGLRRARYRGEAKTQLQETMVAAAINVARATRWFAGRRPEATKPSRLTALTFTA